MSEYIELIGIYVAKIGYKTYITTGQYAIDWFRLDSNLIYVHLIPFYHIFLLKMKLLDVC